MSKFGELIDDKLPLLLVFYSENEEVSNDIHPVLKDVAAALGDKGRQRVERHFCWSVCAQQMVTRYRACIDAC